MILYIPYPDLILIAPDQINCRSVQLKYHLHYLVHACVVIMFFLLMAFFTSPSSQFSGDHIVFTVDTCTSSLLVTLQYGKRSSVLLQLSVYRKLFSFSNAVYIKTTILGDDCHVEDHRVGEAVTSSVTQPSPQTLDLCQCLVSDAESVTNLMVRLTLC